LSGTRAPLKASPLSVTFPVVIRMALPLRGMRSATRRASPPTARMVIPLRMVAKSSR
jgi:hypothetical protein